MEDKTPGINLNDWLNSPITQGLPKSNIKSGELYYWAPMKDNNSVARFGADSGGAGLFCDGGPSGASASLGVRPVVCEARTK